MSKSHVFNIFQFDSLRTIRNKFGSSKNGRQDAKHPEKYIFFLKYFIDQLVNKRFLFPTRLLRRH